MVAVENKSRHTSQADLQGFFFCLFQSGLVSMIIQRIHHIGWIKTTPVGSIAQIDYRSDIKGFCKICMKYLFMKLFIFAHITGIFTGFKRKPGIRKERKISEYDSKLHAAPPEIVKHPGNIVSLESFR